MTRCSGGSELAREQSVRKTPCASKLAPTRKTPTPQPEIITASSARERPPGHTLQQVWFSGAHADVGGGYADRALAEIALQWIKARAEHHGLLIDPDIEPEQPPDPTGKLHDYLATIPGRVLQILHLGARPREIPQHATRHPSVQQRQQATEYTPDNLP